MTTETAFPSKALGGIGYTTGMTLRDYFAAKVMEAMLGSAWNLPEVEIPARAYKVADLMMAARKQ